MILSELHAELQVLAKLKNNWYSVADAIETFKQYHAGHTHILRKVKEVYEANGFTQNAINRMLAVKSFYDASKDKVKELKGVDPNTLSFTSLEISKRLHQVNPGEGLVMLADVAKGEVTSRVLRERYDALIAADYSNASMQQISKREVAEFEEAALHHVSAAAELLFGGSKKITLHSPPEQQLPLTISAVAKADDSEIADISLYGLDFFYFRDQESFKKRIESFLHRLVFNASFFTATWVILPPGAGSDCENALSSILDLQDCPSIGIAKIPWRDSKKDLGRLKIIRRPKLADIAVASGKLKTFSKLHKQLLSTEWR